MTVKTLYTLLGVDSTATFQDIEDAFTRLKLRHPAKLLETDDEARMRFRAIQQAYDTLSDPDSRAVYDQRIKKAGVRVDTSYASAMADTGGGMLGSTGRNIILVGLIIVLVSGMWWWYAREKAREEAETRARILKLAEEEKKRQADLDAAQEARRQAAFEASQKMQDDARARMERQDAQNTLRQIEADQRNQQNRDEVLKRQQQLAQDRQTREAQLAKIQAERDAQNRVQLEKQQLRQMCLDRYRRPDC